VLHHGLLVVSAVVVGSLWLPLGNHISAGWRHAGVLHGPEGCAVVSLNISAGWWSEEPEGVCDHACFLVVIRKCCEMQSLHWIS